MILFAWTGDRVINPAQSPTDRYPPWIL